MNPIAVDFETFYSKKLKYGIRELGAYGYCNHPLFDPYLIAVSDGEQSWAGDPKNFNWDALSGRTLLSHNEYFDGLVYATMVKRGMAPKIVFEDWLCTANMTSYLCNRRSLADSVEFLLGVRLSKDVRSDADGKTSNELRADAAGWERMLTYGRSDSDKCHEMFMRYGHLWPQHERELSRLTIEQGRRGVQINVELLKKYIAVTTEMLRLTEQTLPWMNDGRAPTSTIAIGLECRKHGIPCPPVKSREGEDAFLEWEAAYSPKYPWIESVGNWRSINKFLETLLTIAERITPEGILPFALKYFGAHTGRWSGDAGLNFQNFRKEPIYRDENGLMVSQLPRLKEIENCGKLKTPLPSWVTFTLDIRALITHRADKKMIISDLSQIEPRVLAWIVGDEQMLSLMASGQSPYEAHARATMNWTGGDMKKEDKNGYALAKARVLGLGYGCGWRKFIVVAHAMAGLDITVGDPEWEWDTDSNGDVKIDEHGEPKKRSGYGASSRRIVQEYRDGNPLIVGLWRSLDNAFKNSEGGDFEMTLPSGRVMRYGQVRQEHKMVIDEETGKMRAKRVYTAMVGDRRTTLYGGLLVENLVQAASRDVFAFHCLELQKTAGIDVLFTVHDEAVNECEPDIQVKDVEQIMARCPDWIRGLPLAAEGCEAAHYKK